MSSELALNFAIASNSQKLLINFVKFIDAKTGTVRAYLAGIKSFLRYCREKNIPSPSREDVINFKNNLAISHKPTTIQLYLSGLRKFFSWLESIGLWKNITINVKGFKVSRNFKKDCLTVNQVKELLKSINRDNPSGKRDFAIILLMVTTGLRDIEVSRANINDIRTLYNCNVLYIQGKGKNDKEDCVKIAPIVEKAIRIWLQTRNKIKSTDPIFCGLSRNGIGKRLTTRSISRIIKERLKAIGINNDRITAHSLRHTAATLALFAGNSLEKVKQFLRHADISTTMIYNHAMDRINNNCELDIANSLLSDTSYGERM